MKAIQIEEFGGPEVLKHVEVPDPTPGEASEADATMNETFRSFAGEAPDDDER